MKLLPTHVLPLLLIIGCGSGQEVTQESVRAAQTKWDKAGIKNYNLEWVSKGARNVHYRVFVRDSIVKAIYAVLPDGREVVAKPAEPKFYGVDGLFITIFDEIGQLKTASPFGMPKGVKAVLKFDPDPNLGYPRTYRRDLLGTPQGLAIDVIRLEPNATRPIPLPEGDQTGR